jgi:hypothetical protein
MLDAKNSKGDSNMATKKSMKATTGTSKASKGHAPKTASAAKTEKKKMSALDAAARVLAEGTEPMSCAQLIEVMGAKGYWKSPAGKTPGATLSSAIQREINVKKDESRFKKTSPGRFTARQQG